MERRFTPHPAKLEKRDGDKSAITGYGAVFYDGTPATQYELWEGCVERIMPGTFDRAIAEKDDVRGLFNHDPNQILGRTSAGTMQLSIDSRGLRYEITPGNTTIANDVQQHLGRGDVTGSSFAFDVSDQEIRQEDGVWIIEIRGISQLYDTGPVTFPAYTATEANARDAQAAKQSIERFKEKLNSEAAARSAGYLALARAVEVENEI